MQGHDSELVPLPGLGSKTRTGGVYECRQQFLSCGGHVFQEDATGWDPITICRWVDPITRLYALILLVAMIVGAVRIVKLWIAAPPFRLERKRNNHDYLRLLESSCSSTKQWMGLAVLGWAFLVSREAVRFGMYADETRRTGWAFMLSTTQLLGAVTEFAIIAVLLLFLVRWHMLNRIQQIRAWATLEAARDQSTAM